MTYDIVSIGSIVHDTAFYSDAFSVIDNPENDPTREQLLCIEFGAKVKSDQVYQLYGGGAANTAINMRGLGLKTAVLGSIGADPQGEGVLAHLESEKVDTRYIQTHASRATGFSFITIDQHTGERTVFVHYGATAAINVTKKQLAPIDTQYWYVTSLQPSNWASMIKAIQRTGIPMAWNPGSTQLQGGMSSIGPLLKKTDVLMLNKDEASELILSQPRVTQTGSIKDMLQQLHDAGPRLVLITDGKKGATVYNGEEYYHQKSPNDHPVDTTGAGDCFGSSFIAGLHKYKGDIKKSLELAQYNVNSLVQHVGAQQGFLKWRDLPARLKKR